MTERLKYWSVTYFARWNCIFHVRYMNYEEFSSHINFNFGLVEKFKLKGKVYFFVISGILSYNGKVEILVGNLFWEWNCIFHVRYMNYEVFSSHINYNFGLVKKFKRKRKVHFFWTFDILSCDGKVKILVGNLFCGWNCIFHVRYMNYEEFSSHINFHFGLVEKFKLKGKVYFFVISGILSYNGKVEILVGNLFWEWDCIFHVRYMNYEVFSSHINHNFGLD